MRITKISIDNYKSIQHIEFDPRPGINTFLGENNVGKSNVFDAINWLIWYTYPTFNSVTNLHHRKWDPGNKIDIQITYDDGRCLAFSENWIDSFGNEKSWLHLDDSSVNSARREHYCSASLWIDRKIQHYLPSNKWSLIGRIFRQINNQFETEYISDWNSWDMILKTDLLKQKLETVRDDVLFSVGRAHGASDNWLMDKFLLTIQQEAASQLNTSPADFSLDLSLYDPWNFYKTLQLLVKDPNLDMEFQASDTGMWVQASITIAILKAYAEMNLPNKTPIFIDEPELFLHPHAQKNFYNILRELSEDKEDEDGNIIPGVQIFYTTHSPNFLRMDRFDEIFVVRKDPDDWTYISSSPMRTFSTHDRDKVRHLYENTWDSQKTNEAFFAKKIILVEWQTESLLLPYFFDLIWYDYVKDWVSIVRCGNKENIHKFFKIYGEFSIPCFIVFDWDKNHIGTVNEKGTQNLNKQITSLCVSSPIERPDGIPKERYLWFEEEIGKTLWFSTTKKGLKLFKEVKDHINTPSDLPVWVHQLIDKLQDFS